jgi:glutamate 5-kinase
MTDELDPTVRGNQPAGPARWARAKQWAEKNPHTATTARYYERIATAERVAKNLPEQAWLHYRTGGMRAPVYTGQTCSTKCAMLQLQVNSSATGFEALQEYLQKDRVPYFVTERPADSKRRGKCLVCGGDVI